VFTPCVVCIFTSRSEFEETADQILIRLHYCGLDHPRTRILVFSQNEKKPLKIKRLAVKKERPVAALSRATWSKLGPDSRF